MRGAQPRRLLALIAAACVLLVPATPALGAAGPPGPAANVQLARLGGIGRGGGFGRRGIGGGFGRRGFGSHGTLRRIVHALTFAYLLHLLFTTPGGWLVLIVLILFVVWIMRRITGAGRRPRYRY